MENNCHNLTVFLDTIGQMAPDFDEHVGFVNRDVESALILYREILRRTREVQVSFEIFENISRAELKKQYNEQLEAYLKTNLLTELPSGRPGFVEDGKEYPFPRFEAVMMYFSRDRKLVRAISEKARLIDFYSEERLGFRELLITPFAMNLGHLKDVAINTLKENGGLVDESTHAEWEKQDDISYFCKPTWDTESYFVPGISSGVKKDAILRKPDFLLDGYSISMSLNIDDIFKYIESIERPTGGRYMSEGIKADISGISYLRHLKKLESDESSILPEEWLSLFISKFYQSHMKNSEAVSAADFNLLDVNGSILFPDTTLSDSSALHLVWWQNPAELCLDIDESGSFGSTQGFRSVVRKKFR
jgi:hypothetical protein